MPAASHPPSSRAMHLRWSLAALAAAALAFGGAWQMLAACDAVLLILLLRQIASGRPAAPALLHPASVKRLPKLSLHLAVRDAVPERLGRTLEALARLDYPDLEVLVVDSNTADPARWASAARHCARLGARFRFFALGPWPGGRAGALAFARAETAPDAELIGVLRDGDLPDANWLRRAASGFADARLGAVAAALRAGTDDAPVLLIRTAALDQAGGWASGYDAVTAELMLRLSGLGWQVLRSGRTAGHTERDQGDPAKAPFRFGQMLRGHWRQLLPACGGAAVPAMPAAIWLADAMLVPAFALCLLWSASLAAFPGTVGFPPVATLAPLLALAALRIGLAARRPLASVPALANVHRSGLAVWCGLLDIGAAPPPGIPQQIRLALLALAAACVAARHPFGGLAEAAWFLLLLAMALPDLAALCVRPALHRPRHLMVHTGTGD